MEEEDALPAPRCSSDSKPENMQVSKDLRHKMTVTVMKCPKGESSGCLIYPQNHESQQQIVLPDKSWDDLLCTPENQGQWVLGWEQDTTSLLRGNER